MENNIRSEFTLSFLLITALCLETAIIEITLCPAEEMDWADARNYCQKNHNDLITWNAVDELQLTSWLNEFSAKKVWIGLHRDPDNSSAWQWVNVKTGEGVAGGDVSQSTHWANGQQSNLCAFVGNDLMWHSDRCLNSHSVYCSQGDKVLHYSGGFTWYEASLYCQGMNTNLATITNTHNDGLQYTGWIGLYQETSTSWSWIGNQPFIYSNWASGEPLTQDCVYFNTANQKWYSNECSDGLQSVCYDDNLVLVKENKTWEEALAYCEFLITECDDPSGPCIYHHQLLSLQHSHDYSYVRDRIYTATTDEIWTGLRFLGGQWWWINGQELDDQGMLPDCPSLQEHCGTLSKYDTNNWITRDCSERKNFICLRYLIYT